MVNQNVNLIVEDTQDSVFIKPANICDDSALNKHTCVPFNQTHDCEHDSCNCMQTLKGTAINNIVNLSLTCCNLKSIPNICNLPLKSLDLSHNLLKSVPECLLKALDNLEILNLSHNSIREFETQPKCVFNLKILDLKNNSLDYLPLWIVHVKSYNLIELDYSHNYCGKTNESLYNKVCNYSLKKMAFQNSYLVNDNLIFLKSIKTLEYLDVSNISAQNFKNMFTNYEELFKDAAWKDTINTLLMSSLNMGFLPDDLCHLHSLKELYLSNNNIVWLPDTIGDLVSIEILDLSKNSICFLPQTVKKLKKLRILYLQENNLADVDTLNDLNLELLDLYQNDLDSPNFNITKLKYADLEQNYFSTDALDVVYIQQRDNYLKHFNLEDRIMGYRNETFNDNSSSSKSPKHDLSDSDLDEGNLPPDQEDEEECWDDNSKIKSDPDVTTSDEEWQGYLPVQKKKPKPKANLDHLLEYLYVDAD